MTSSKKTPDLEAPLSPTPAPKVPLFRKGAALGGALALGVTLAAGCGDDDGEPPMALLDTGVPIDSSADTGVDTGPPPPMPPPLDSGTGDAAGDGSTGDAASDASGTDTGPPPPMPPPADGG